LEKKKAGETSMERGWGEKQNIRNRKKGGHQVWMLILKKRQDNRFYSQSMELPESFADQLISSCSVW